MRMTSNILKKIVLLIIFYQKRVMILRKGGDREEKLDDMDIPLDQQDNCSNL